MFVLESVCKRNPTTGEVVLEIFGNESDVTVPLRVLCGDDFSYSLWYNLKTFKI